MAAAPTKDEVTEHELKLIGAMRKLKVKPEKVETTEELEKFMKDYEKDGSDRRQFPRLSIFFGEAGKGEVTCQTWKYEIQCLQTEKKYPEDQILMAIRRSAKGEAANILRRLGVKASINDIVKKFNSTFGDIDSPELTMKKVYAAEQGPTESLITYAARIEELFAQAVEVKALDPGQETILKSVFYKGLRQPLKQFGNLKFETIKDYDRFNNRLYHSEEKEIIVDHATIEDTIIEVNLTEAEANTDRIEREASKKIFDDIHIDSKLTPEQNEQVEALLR